MNDTYECHCGTNSPLFDPECCRFDFQRAYAKLPNCGQPNPCCHDTCIPIEPEPEYPTTWRYRQWTRLANWFLTRTAPARRLVASKIYDFTTWEQP